MNNRLSTNWEDFKSHMKKGGWKKGAVLGTAIAVVPIVLVGCVEQTQAVEVNIQDKELSSAQEIQNFLGDEYSLNQTIKEAVEDYAKESYGQNAKVLSVVAKGNDLFGGNIYAMIENEGKVFALEIQNNLSASQFDAKVYKKDTFSFENNILKFTQDGKDKEINLEVDGIAYVYNSETGDLTTVETSDFENAISGAVKSAVEIDVVLSSGLDANQESDFKFVLGQIYAENVKAQFPGIEIEYNASKDKTIVRADFAKTDGTIEKITVEFDGFVKDGENLNQEEALKQFETEKAVVSSENVEVAKEYLQIYVSGDKAYSVEFVVDGPEQGGETEAEENIEFSSWSDVFNVFGEENSNYVKDEILKVLQKDVFNYQHLGMYIFGGSENDAGDYQVSKISFDIQNNMIVGFQCLVEKTNVLKENDFMMVNVKVPLNNFISLDDVKAKKNAIYQEGENIYWLGEGEKGIVLDLNGVINKISFNSNSIQAGTPFSGEIPTQEKKDLFNLLMPYAVSEKTTYSHISISYSSSTDSEFGTCFGIAMYCYNENTNSYEHWGITADDNQASGKTAYERIVEAVKKGDFRVTNPTNKEIISGDIMLEMDENQNFYEISPNLETEKV